MSLVFDDGFSESCQRTAKIFEARNLKATFAVLANTDGFCPDFPNGDFNLWNHLQECGHIINPHGYDHSDLTKIPFAEAKAKIDACLNYFSEHLAGFDASKSMYHLTYNKSTSLVDEYLLSVVRAIRTTGLEGLAGSGMNNENELSSRIYNCSWLGPEHCDEHLLSSLQLAEKLQPKVFMYMLHGIDNEGWGPIHSNALERALDYILASPQLNYVDTSML